MYPCERCSGTGELPQMSHVEGGVCFKCRGTGKQANKPVDRSNPNECDAIYNFINDSFGDEDPRQSATIWVWLEDNPCKHGNTGHYCINDNSDMEYHRPLQECRDMYKQLMSSGYRIMVGAELKAYCEKVQQYWLNL